MADAFRALQFFTTYKNHFNLTTNKFISKTYESHAIMSSESPKDGYGVDLAIYSLAYFV